MTKFTLAAQPIERLLIYKELVPNFVNSLLISGNYTPLVSCLLAARFGIGDDPNPNPVLFGILAWLTFYPSLGLIAWGFFRRYRQKKSS